MSPAAYSMMPAAALGLFLLAALLPESLPGLGPLALDTLTEAAALGVPLLVFGLIGRKSCPLGFRLRFSRFRFIPFVLSASAAVSLFSFFSSYLTASLLGGAALRDMVYGPFVHYGGTPGWLLALALGLAPALMEEIFFRGGLFSGLEDWGQPAATLISSLCFAMVCGSAATFLGLLVSGLVFGYMTAATDSIWPAAAGRLIHNLVNLAMGYALRRYAVFGAWPYLMILGAALLFLCTYLAAACLESLLAKGRVRRLRGGKGPQAALSRVLCPGVLATAALFAVKIVWIK